MNRPIIFFSCLVIVGGCSLFSSPAATQGVADLAAANALKDAELACVAQSNTLAESRVCRNKVRADFAAKYHLTIPDLPVPDGGK